MDLLFFFGCLSHSRVRGGGGGGINSNLVEGLFWGFALFSSLHTVVGGLRSGHFKSSQGRHETSKEKQIDKTFHPRVPKGEDPELLASSVARYFHFHKIFKQLVCETGRPYLVRRGAIDTALKVRVRFKFSKLRRCQCSLEAAKKHDILQRNPSCKNALIVVTSVDLHAGFMEIL